tara:strand:+ start:4402 stop:6609 length:2208 start_codon:yes stop_codon:yes gene_type:complete
MPLVPLDIPAGFYKNGTDYEGSNRWHEGSLVRWLDGSLRPIGGWRVRVDNITTDPVRGMHAWQDLTNNAWIVAGAADELVAITGGGDVHDIKPDDLTAGSADATVGIGYGNGTFGSGTFGQPRPVSTSSVPIPATSWDIDNFGQLMVACSVSDGRILEWDLSYVAGSELVTNGTFASDTAWTKGTGWTISGGLAKYAGTTITSISQTASGLSNSDPKQDTHEIKVTVIDPNTGTQTITVTVASIGGANRFVLDGNNYPSLTLYKGFTYIFDQSDATNSTHPLLFRDASGNPYTTNVVTTGTAGSAGAKVTITIPTSGTQPASYLCQTHGAAMGNSITTMDDPTIPVPRLKVTSGTLVINETLVVGENKFRFAAGATTALIEIEPNTINSVDFHIDDVSLKNVPVAEVIDNAPVNNLGLIVTEERFIFALGSGGNSRKISWCDKEDRDTWSAAATNEAGDIELATSGQIMSAVRTRGSTLIITDFDCFQAVYQGPPYVYSFSRVGTNCGAISRKCAMSTDLGVFYMGQENFFAFNGNTVSVITCDVHDYVFGDFNYEQQSKVWGMVNGAHQECWWFYPSSSSTEVDRYVAFDFMEKHWLVGELSRTSGIPRGVFQYPLMVKDEGNHCDLMDHEIGNAYDASSVFAETGPISIGVGDQIAKVNSVIPDEVTQGDVDMIFKTRFHPNDTERSYGPFNPANPTGVRFSGRQVRMRVEQDQTTDWRVGIMRLETVAGGKR